MLTTGKYADAVAMCDRAIAATSRNTAAIAYKLLALKQLGRTEEYSALADFGLIAESEIGVTDAFQNTATLNDATLNDAIVEQIINHPKLFAFDKFEITYNGREVKNILEDPGPPIEAWRETICRCVEDYAARLPRGSDHPFVSNQPVKWEIIAWANILGDQGYQQAYIHEKARLSGVYYVKVPESVGADPDSHAGCIAFGPPAGEFWLPQEIEQFWYTPTAGNAILFPAYFFHHTIPTGTPESRITIAFDVVANEAI